VVSLGGWDDIDGVLGNNHTLFGVDQSVKNMGYFQVLMAGQWVFFAVLKTCSHLPIARGMISIKHSALLFDRN
jgi:hypothetical protein